MLLPVSYRLRQYTGCYIEFLVFTEEIYKTGGEDISMPLTKRCVNLSHLNSTQPQTNHTPSPTRLRHTVVHCLGLITNKTVLRGPCYGRGVAVELTPPQGVPASHSGAPRQEGTEPKYGYLMPQIRYTARHKTYPSR